MRLTAGRPLLPLLLLCFNCLAAENGKSDPGNHNGSKGRRSHSEALGKRSKDYMEMSFDDPAANTPIAEFPCPAAPAIEPCVCSTGSADNRLYMDCTLVESEEQLAAVFQQEFPVKEFYQFSMSSNSAVKVFHNFMNGITFESLVLSPGSFVLEAISDYFLLSLKDTVEIIQIQNSKLMTDVFPFIMLPLMSELSTLQFIGSEIKQIPAIRSPNLSDFAVTSSPVERLLNGTISVGTGAMSVNLRDNNISTIEPGSIFFADEESAASSEPLSIILKGNKIQSLQAGTFHLRNGLFWLFIWANQIAFIEPGTFVLPEASDSMTLHLSLEENELTTIDEAVFGGLMPFIAHLGLAENPLTCGCDIAWLILNTDYMSVVDSRTSCADGTLLGDLNPQDFVDWCLV